MTTTYHTPQIEIVMLSSEDVICASGDGDLTYVPGVGDGTEHEW